jgi:hypothetical protein
VGPHYHCRPSTAQHRGTVSSHTAAGNSMPEHSTAACSAAESTLCQCSKNHTEQHSITCYHRLNSIDTDCCTASQKQPPHLHAGKTPGQHKTAHVSAQSSPLTSSSQCCRSTGAGLLLSTAQLDMAWFVGPDFAQSDPFCLSAHSNTRNIQSLACPGVCTQRRAPMRSLQPSSSTNDKPTYKQ